MIGWRLLAIIAALVAAGQLRGADVKEWKERRQRAAAAFSDGVLLLHSNTTMGFLSDGYREEPAFYYLTGLEDSPGTILAIVGKSGECWLFVPTAESKGGAETRPGEEAARKTGLEHVVNWKELQGFLTEQTKAGAKIYYKPEAAMLPEIFPQRKITALPVGFRCCKRIFRRQIFSRWG
jgi:Aminopeptidase P, N-terminal domain